MIRAVVFDLDGVIVDSEHLWDEVREALARERGRPYTATDQQAMMGMSSIEWSRYMHEVVGLQESPPEIDDEVVRRMLERYEAELPLIPGAPAAVRSLGEAGLRLAVASSSNPPLIAAVLRGAGIEGCFAAVVSSGEVARGKPAPDVYLEAASRLQVDPATCVAVEDSANGIRSAAAAGMRVIAIPNRRYPPPPDVVALAGAVLDDVGDLDAGLVRSLGDGAGG